MKGGKPHSPALGWGNVPLVKTRDRLILGGMILLTWIYTFTRAIPLRDGDRGVFVSMAERIAAGDTLYVDVWDNKEPLFFLTLAAGRQFSPFMDIALELMWLILSSIAVYQIAKSQKLPNLLAIFTGFVATPIILTGSVYYAGFSHLPATAVFLGITAFALTRHFFLVGLLLPVLAGFKIITVPLALAALGVTLTFIGFSKIKPIIFGTLISSGLLTTLLLIRGEFTGFIDLILSNIGYSQSSISDAYDIPVWKHIEPVLTAATMTTLATIAVILLIYKIRPSSRSSELLWLTGLTTLAAFIVIVITGLWPHHGQIFAGPAAIAAVLIALAFTSKDHNTWKIAALIFLSATLLAGMPSLRTVVDSGLSTRDRVQELTRVAEPTQALLELADSGTYHRLGKNTDDSHAYGLSNFELGCYQFVQYTYDLPETLEYIPSCLPTVDYLIVDKGLVYEEGQDRWNTFVEQSEVAIAENFNCTELEWGRLCKHM
jgi:hypothetical protein